MRQPRCIAPTGDWCGEGPVWCAEEQSLYWTDINRFLIHRISSDGAVRSWFFQEPVTALALTSRSGTLAVALASRLVWWRPDFDERRDHGFQLPGWPAVRLNDGRPDPRGSFWAGSMRNNVAPDGSPREAGGSDGVLFRIDRDGAVSEWKRDIGISNTLAWSPDHSLFYFADTLRNTIYVYDYDLATGAIGNERPFFAGFERGVPDGSAMDSEGCLWNCRWGGGCVVRIAPGGAIDRVIEMPVQNVTSCTFGGPELRTLYITTASLGAPAGRLSGGLFALETGIQGLPEHRFL
jgi:sugar lactone lactonase YvrE